MYRPKVILRARYPGVAREEPTVVWLRRAVGVVGPSSRRGQNHLKRVFTEHPESGRPESV
jgi:hypothetical protein